MHHCLNPPTAIFMASIISNSIPRCACIDFHVVHVRPRTLFPHFLFVDASIDHSVVHVVINCVGNVGREAVRQTTQLCCVICGSSDPNQIIVVANPNPRPKEFARINTHHMLEARRTGVLLRRLPLTAVPSESHSQDRLATQRSPSL